MKTPGIRLVVLALALAAGAQAQSMEETVSKLGVSAGKAYVAPIVSAFGSNLNGGWYHRAPAAKKFAFHVEAGVVTMATLLSGGKKTFEASGAFRLDSAAARNVAEDVDTNGMFGQGQRFRDSITAAIRRTDINVDFSGPTIIGDKDGHMVYVVATDPLVVGLPNGQDTTIILPATADSIKDQNGNAIEFGILHALSFLPSAAPQLTVGTLFGTNLTLRWLPDTKTTDEIGKVKFFGFGVQHNPGVWMGSTLPVDVSVGYFVQTLQVGTLFKATSQAIGLNASKTFGGRFLNLTPYGGIQVEKSNFDFSYDFEVDEEVIPIEFSVAGENKFRATAGLSVHLLALNINADYNFGKYNSATVGLMVGF
jgi:hypothetical protein